MTEKTLFPDLAPSAEEQIQIIDAKIGWLLYGKQGGPLNLALSIDEKTVLRRIRYRRGAANAITIAEMRASCDGRLSERQIKQIVRMLRINFHLPIGSNKGGAGGYFVMISSEDRAIMLSHVLDQVRAELEVLRAIDGPKAMLELLGQLRLEIDAMDASR